MAKKGKKKALDPEAAARQAAAEAEEKKRIEMIKEAMRLRANCEREENHFHQFLMEREKINYFWIVEKKTLTEKQADLRNKQRELQDLEERQQIELKMFQQRLKHLRYHQQDEVVELKTDAELGLKLQEDHHRITEAEIKKDQRALKMEKKEAEVAQQDFTRMLKLEQDQKILELRHEFDRKARDMQQKYELRMKEIREEMEKQRKKQIQQIEESKNTQIEGVMKKNQQDFTEIKVYYQEITVSNFDSIKRLKEDYADIKKTENDDAKKMYDLEQRNKQLKEPMKKAKQDVERLEQEKEAYKEDKKRLAQVKEKIKQSETLLKRMEFQHEVLQQQLAHVTSEREDLYTKFQQAIYDVQQKSGLKNLILEKKIDTVEEALETTEAQITELLASANVDPSTSAGITQKLDQVIAYKDDIVGQLQEEVQRIKDSHSTMVKTYESKLAEYGIPPERSPSLAEHQHLTRDSDGDTVITKQLARSLKSIMACYTWRLCLLLWIFGVNGEGDACFAPAASTKVLLQVAQNSSAGNSSTNKSLKTDDATFETSTLSWSNFQVRLLMLGVMALFFAACAAAWWFSFQHPDAFRLSLQDTMTYNALGLLSWIALVNAARTVWGNYTLWIMACRFLAVVLAIAVLEISLFSDPGSMNPLAFSEITNVLTVFVSLLLGFYLSSSIKRWTTCIDGFLSLFEVIRALQMQLHALGVARVSIAKVVRYGMVSAWLSARLQHIEGLDKHKRKAAVSDTWQELRHSAEPYLRLTAEECEKLKDIDDPCPILWLWVALFLGRLAADGDIPPMASPTYGRMVMLANDAQVALKEVRMCGEVKIPYLYTHTLSAVVHLNNILCAISMGLTLGACIGEFLTIIDPRLTLYGEKSYPTSTASQVGQVLMVQALKCFCAPLLYQACLEICFCLYSAFGGETDEAIIPADRMVREWTKELDGLMDLAAKPPHWSAPVFKTALSHVPDIQRTKAMMQSTKKGIRA